MPFVAVNKARRPKWQDPLPRGERNLRDAYAIAARHVGSFSRAFADAVKSILTPEVLKEIRRRMNDGATAVEITDAIPWFDPVKPDSVELWTKLGDRLSTAYGKVMAEAAAQAPKAIQKKRKLPVVPVNPASVKWARERGSKLIVDISNESRKVVRNVVARTMERGQRADTMVATIRRAVGMLARDEGAVDRRRGLLISQGVTEARANKLSDTYADELLTARATNIARTETIAAQNQGLLDSWRTARDEGALPEAVVRVWVAAPSSDNPNRPCPICLELDGQETGLDEPFQSAELGEAVMTPPSHTNCRCTTFLRRAEES